MNSICCSWMNFKQCTVIPPQENPFVQNLGSIFPGRLIRIRGNVPHDAYR